VFEMLHHNLRETRILMPHAHVGHGRHSVQDEEGVLDIMYPFHVWPVQVLQAGDKHLCFLFL
jgi:hypothetical protein